MPLAHWHWHRQPEPEPEWRGPTPHLEKSDEVEVKKRPDDPLKPHDVVRQPSAHS